jgi:hypothetical protein
MEEVPDSSQSTEQNSIESPVVPVKIIVKQPKVEKPVKEKKPRSEKQQEAVKKMREALMKRKEEDRAILKANEEAERKQREEAVKNAEEEAKKVTDNVIVQKVRGRKPGTKVPVKPRPMLIRSPSPSPISPFQQKIEILKQKGIHIPDNVTPYMLKLILSRYR